MADGSTENKPAAPPQLVEFRVLVDMKSEDAIQYMWNLLNSDLKDAKGEKDAEELYIPFISYLHCKLDIKGAPDKADSSKQTLLTIGPATCNSAMAVFVKQKYAEKVPVGNQ